MTEREITVKMILDRWYGSITNLNKRLEPLSDTQLQKEIAPGKNRGAYVLGHLIAVHDDMLVLLDLGEKLYPDLNEAFLKLPDRASDNIPSASELRTLWSKHCEALHEKFENMKTDHWFEKHTAVSEADFLKEPHRNKLNIIITRTSHLQYHTGQLALLK